MCVCKLKLKFLFTQRACKYIFIYEKKKKKTFRAKQAFERQCTRTSIHRRARNEARHECGTRVNAHVCMKRSKGPWRTRKKLFFLVYA